MSRLTNEEICAAISCSDQLKHAAEQADTIVATAQKSLKILEPKLRAIKDTHFVYKGVPMQVFGRSYLSIYPVSSEVRRYAIVYKNDYTPRRWGLRICVYGEAGVGEFMGADWRRQKDALEAGKDWIVTGEEPEHNGGKPS